MIHANMSKILNQKLRLPHRRPRPRLPARAPSPEPWLPAWTPSSRVVRPPRVHQKSKLAKRRRVHLAINFSRHHRLVSACHCLWDRRWKGHLQRGRRWWWFMRICQRFWITNWGCPIASLGLGCRPGPRALVAGPDTVMEGGKTPKGSSEVKAGQEEKSSSGHQFQSTSSTGFSSSSSLSLSPEGSSSERKKMTMIHANLSKILKHKLRLPHRRPGHRHQGW